jgi:hypothetical protein
MCIHCPTGRRMFAHPKSWRNKQNYETLHFWTTEWHFWVSRFGNVQKCAPTGKRRRKAAL